MKSFFAIVALTLALNSPSIAGDPQTLVITDAGYFVLSADPNGVPVAKKVSSVVDLRSGDNPVPPPSPEPEPTDPEPPKPEQSPDEALSVKAAEWARNENDRAAAGIVSIVYRQVGEAVGRGEFPPDSAAGATKQAIESLVPAGWSTFRERIGAEAAERIATAGPMDAAKMSAFLLSIAIGAERQADPVPLEKAVQATAEINKAMGKN